MRTVDVRGVLELAQTINKVTAETVASLYDGKTGAVELELSDDVGNTAYRVTIKTVRARTKKVAKTAKATTRKTTKKVAKRTRKATTRKTRTRR